MVNQGFLNNEEKADCLRIAKDGQEQNRFSRRANALLWLDGGMKFDQVAKVLFLDDSTIRAWREAFEVSGVESIYVTGHKGGPSLLSKDQTEEVKAWATQTLPETVDVVGKFILDRFELEYGKSGLHKLMHRIGFEWKKPESVPAKITMETQKAFIESHENLRNSLDPDETIVYVDAVHPTHQFSPAGRWLPRGTPCAVSSTSGRDRINLHGALDLESGKTQIIEVEKVNTESTIRLFKSIELAFPAMTRIHVYLDNAKYHHAKLVQEWLARAGCKIVLHFIPPYCPHLNPIERLWLVMNQNISHRVYFPKFRDWAEAVLKFLRETVPEEFERFSSTITDNFRVIDPGKFRILA